MKMSFNTMFNQPGANGNPIGNLGKGSAKWLSILGCFLVVMGILVIKYPVVLANIVAGILFIIAFFVFSFALKCLRMAKQFQNTMNAFSQEETPPHNNERVFVDAKQL